MDATSTRYQPKLATRDSFYPRNTALLLLLVPLLLGGCVQLFEVASKLRFQGDNTYPESTVVQTAIWSRTTGQIYPSLDRPPYTPAPYGPLFYVTLAGVAKADHLDFDQLLLVGRVFVCFSYLVLAAGAFAWERRQGLTPLAALLAPAFVFAEVDFLDWNVSVRPDLIALLLTLIAFYFLTSRRNADTRGLLTAAVFCGLAGLFKQSFIALPLSVMAWLFWNRRPLNALYFAGILALIGAGVIGILVLHHEPVIQHLLLARYSPLSFSSAIDLLVADFLRYPVQVVLLGLAILGLLSPTGEQSSIPRVLCGTYFIMAWLMGFYTAMAPGASTNAFLEAWLLCCLFAPLGAMTLGRLSSVMPSASRAGLFFVWSAIALLSLKYWRTIVYSPAHAKGELATAVSGKRLLTDIPYVAVHGNRPELLDPSVNHYLELSGRWTSAEILRQLQDEEFDYVIVGMNRGRARQWRGLTIFSGSILRQVQADYRPFCAGDDFAVYIPRSAQAPTAGATFSRARCETAPGVLAGLRLQ